MQPSVPNKTLASCELDPQGATYSRAAVLVETAWVVRDAATIEQISSEKLGNLEKASEQISERTASHSHPLYSPKPRGRQHRIRLEGQSGSTRIWRMSR